MLMGLSSDRDWEPYHFRAPHGSQAHGLPYSPMGSIGSGTRAERHGRGAGGGDNHRDKERNGDDIDGYQGGVMRDGGLITSRRDQQSSKYRSKFEERDPDMLKIDKRYPATGKNPFGQVSASGTFKPAGKEGLEGGVDRRYNAGRRDRDAPLSGYSEDRSRGARNGRDPRDRRRGGPEDGEDDEEWESVPKSPENERRSKASLGESAMEWRRTTGKLPGKGSLPSGRERERETGRKTSFPAWMAEESEPSWMSEGQDDSQQYQMGGGAGGSSSRGDGREGSGRSRPHEEDEIDVDTSGMDGIQAFKAQMKERERRERERQQGGTASIQAAAGPPPGLERRTESDEHDANKDGMAALHSVGMNQQDKSAAALFDNFASSAKQRQQEKQQQQMQYMQGDLSDSKGDGDVDQVMPSRSSRFARFFDGKPQAAALAAQQKQMEASQRIGGGEDGGGAGSIRSPASPPNNEQASGNLADLFKSMSTEKSHTSEGTGGSSAPAAPPGLHKNPTDADVQGMQKIMALLSSGGGEVKGQDGSIHANKHVRHPGPPPSMPPGINLSADSHLKDREMHHQGGQSGSPTSSLHHAQAHHQPPGSWANALTSPRQTFDSHIGSYSTSPPSSNAQQNQQQQQAPFRPPFGIDPRLLARGPPPPQGMPPQFGSPPPPGSMGRGGMPPNFAIPPFPSGVRPPPPMPPLPPQLQQHMMTLPPQAQHQLLMQHLQHHGLAHNAFGGPPPQQTSPQHHMAGPHNGGHNSTSPLPPFLSPSPASSNASQSAQLMALLGQGHGGQSRRN